MQRGTIWLITCHCFSRLENDRDLQGILDEVWKHKLIFVETPDANETSIALENYRRVCSKTAEWLTRLQPFAGLQQRSWRSIAVRGSW